MNAAILILLFYRGWNFAAGQDGQFKGKLQNGSPVRACFERYVLFSRKILALQPQNSSENLKIRFCFRHQKGGGNTSNLSQTVLLYTQQNRQMQCNTNCV
jgi:hypothetical protein